MITRRALAALIFAAPIVTTTGFATETPVKAEKNPPGDIPDDQVFIAYASPLGFDLKVPEGWARTDRADGVVFADKYGKIEVTVAAGDPPMRSKPPFAPSTLRRSRPPTGRPAGRSMSPSSPTPSPMPSLTNRFGWKTIATSSRRAERSPRSHSRRLKGLTMRTSGS